jgi:hypothetical protein
LNSIFTQNSASHITNAGILASDVALNLAGTTEDIFTDFKKIGHIIKNGKVIGTINLGGGNDHFNGGANAETVKDSDGSDVYKFGGGNDTYIALNGGAADGTDIVNGGKGIDTYDASNATAGLGINLCRVSRA